MNKHGMVVDGGGFDSFRFVPLNREKKMYKGMEQKKKNTLPKPIIAVTGTDQRHFVCCAHILFCILIPNTIAATAIIILCMCSVHACIRQRAIQRKSTMTFSSMHLMLVGELFVFKFHSIGTAFLQYRYAVSLQMDYLVERRERWVVEKRVRLDT